MDILTQEQAKEKLNLWIITSREKGSKRRLGQDVEWESKYKEAKRQEELLESS